MDEEYTGKDLFEALKYEQSQSQKKGEYFWGHSSTMTSLVDDLHELNVLEYTENGEIVIDEKAFELLYKLRVELQRESVSAPNDTVKNMHPAFNPDYWNGQYYGCTLYGAPQIAAVYAKSGAASEGEEAHIYWIPTLNNRSEYIRRVVDIAMLGAKSERKQQAYDVIRLMMDMPINVYKIAGWNNAPQTYSPVNINRALQLLEEYNSEEEQLIIKDFWDDFVDLIEKRG